MTGAAAEAPIVKRARRVAGNKGLLRTILMLIVPAILVIGGGYYWLTSGGSVSTDDAQVKQDIVSVSAQVNGPIVQAFVRNGSQVKRGDLLFRIDPAPYRVALEQADGAARRGEAADHAAADDRRRHRRRYRRRAGQSRRSSAMRLAASRRC